MRLPDICLRKNTHRIPWRLRPACQVPSHPRCPGRSRNRSRNRCRTRPAACRGWWRWWAAPGAPPLASVAAAGSNQVANKVAAGRHPQPACWGTFHRLLVVAVAGNQVVTGDSSRCSRQSGSGAVAVPSVAVAEQLGRVLVWEGLLWGAEMLHRLKN